MKTTTTIINTEGHIMVTLCSDTFTLDQAFEAAMLMVDNMMPKNDMYSIEIQQG